MANGARGAGEANEAAPAGSTPSRHGSGCLDEETLAQLVFGRASESVTGEVWRHLDVCPTCSALAAELAKHSGTPPPHRGSGPLPEVSPGATVGRYVVLHRVGAGGMGVVYAAYDPDMDRKVALKLVRSSSVTADLTREARALARVTHPNVVAAYDVGTHEASIALVMEFVDGVTLRTWLRVKRRTAGEIVELFRPMGEGLAAAHEARVVHRDFKPENVLIGRDGRPRVTDFGLALRPEVLEGDGHEPRALVGTLPYMAPEQLRGERVDAQADQFAFATSLYEALHGRRPFAGESRTALLSAMQQGLLPQAIDPSLPPPVRQVLSRALAFDPGRRFASMTALVSELAPPTRASHRGLLALAFLAPVLTAGAIWGVVHERRAARDALCHGAEKQLAGVWDAPRSADLAKAFRATPKAPYVETTLRSVQEGLNAYATRWAETRTEVCEATRVRGEQSEALLDERMECLEDRRRELSSLVRELAVASPHAVEVGVQAVDALSPSETCAGRRPGPGLVRDAAKAAERDALRDAIASAQAKLDVGEGEKALAFIRDVLPRLRAVGDVRLIAEAQLVFGRGASGKDLKPAEEALLESVWSFESLGDDDGVARALLRLVPLRGTLMADAASAERDERMAQATLTRLGSPADLEADLLVARASRLLYGDELGAKVAADQALVALAGRGLGDKLLASVAWGIIGSSCIDRGENVCARESFDQALRIRERLSGPSHPMSLLLKADRALVDSKQGHQHEAIAALDEVLSGLALAGRTSTYESAMAHTGRGWALTRLGDLPQAQAEFERATQIDREVEGDHPWTAASLAFVGLVQRLRGNPSAALATYQQASDVLSRAKTTDPATAANILAGRGAAELALGRASLARASLEAAVTAYDGTAFEPPERADAAFALARALRSLGQDSARVRTLAESARDGYATNLAVYADEHGQVEQFLAAMPAL